MTTFSAPWFPPLVKGLAAAAAFALLMAMPPLWRRLMGDDGLAAGPGDNGLD